MCVCVCVCVCVNESARTVVLKHCHILEPDCASNQLMRIPQALGFLVSQVVPICFQFENWSARRERSLGGGGGRFQLQGRLIYKILCFFFLSALVSVTK